MRVPPVIKPVTKSRVVQAVIQHVHENIRIYSHKHTNTRKSVIAVHMVKNVTVNSPLSFGNFSVTFVERVVYATEHRRFRL